MCLLCNICFMFFLCFEGFFFFVHVQVQTVKCSLLPLTCIFLYVRLKVWISLKQPDKVQCVSQIKGSVKLMVGFTSQTLHEMLHVYKLLFTF